MSNVKTNFTLLRDLVMIFPIAAKQQVESGLIVTSMIDKTAPQEGFVVAVGPGDYDKKNNFFQPPVKAGDRIIFSRTNVQEIKLDGDVFMVVPSSEVLVKLQKVDE